MASMVSSGSDIEVIDAIPALKKAKVNAKPPPGKQRASRKKVREVLPVGKSFIFVISEIIPNTVCFCKLTLSYDVFVNSMKYLFVP